MENLTILQYKWDTGVYGLEELSKLVQLKEITEKDFFEITRYNYKSIQEEKRRVLKQQS